MHREPSRPPLLIILSLIVMLAVLVLGCAPCCSWWGSGFGLNGGGGATVSGTAYITISGQQTPVPKVAVTLGVSASTAAKYSTTTNFDGYFELKNVVPGTYFIRIAGGDLGWTDSITVKKDASLNLGNIQLHPTLPPPNTNTEQYPATPEDVIRAYYKAINEGDYNLTQHNNGGYISQFYGTNPFSIYTMGGGNIVRSVTDPSVTVFLDSASYGNPAGYAIGGFYFPYGSGNVEGIAFRPREQTGESQILTSFILGNKFILTQETSRPVDPTPSPPAELPYAGR